MAAENANIKTVADSEPCDCFSPGQRGLLCSVCGFSSSEHTRMLSKQDIGVLRLEWVPDHSHDECLQRASQAIRNLALTAWNSINDVYEARFYTERDRAVELLRWYVEEDLVDGGDEFGAWDDEVREFVADHRV